MLEMDLGIVLSPELETVHQPLGGEGEIDEGGFVARVADAPLAHRLSRLLPLRNKEEPNLLEYYSRFDLWLVPHKVSVVRKHGLAEVTAVGFEAEYLNNSKTCSVVSLIPSPKFVQHGGGQIRFRSSLTGFGELGAAMTLGPMTESIAGSGSLKMVKSAATGIFLELSAVVTTPVISAVGIGARRCEWVFHKETDPLFGRDIEAWSIIALPKRQKALRFRMKAYITTRLAFFSTRRESEWRTLECRPVD